MEALLNNIERDIKKLKGKACSISIELTTAELLAVFSTLIEKYKSVNITYNKLEAVEGGKLTDEEKKYTTQVTIGF